MISGGTGGDQVLLCRFLADAQFCSVSSFYAASAVPRARCDRLYCRRVATRARARDALVGNGGGAGRVPAPPLLATTRPLFTFSIYTSSSSFHTGKPFCSGKAVWFKGDQKKKN